MNNNNNNENYTKVTISTADDTTSTECIVPIIEVPNQSQKIGVNLRPRISLKSQNDMDANNINENKESVVKALKITSNDCLVCTGCVTSSEEVLLMEQNSEKLTPELLTSTGKSQNVQVIISISSSSLFSLCSKYNLPILKQESESIAYIIKGIKESMFAKFQGIVPLQNIHVISEDNLMRMSVKETYRRILESPQTNFVTHCPAVRMYIEKKYSTLKNHLDNVPSPLEIFYILLSSGAFQFLPEAEIQSKYYQFENFTINYSALQQSASMTEQYKQQLLAGCLSISVQPCHDRKIEKIKGSNVDLVLTTHDIDLCLQALNNFIPVTSEYLNEISKMDYNKQQFYNYYFLEYYVQEKLGLQTIEKASEIMNNYISPDSTKNLIIYNIPVAQVTGNINDLTVLRLIRLSGFKSLQLIANKYSMQEGNTNQGMTLLQKKRAMLMASKGLSFPTNQGQQRNIYADYLIEFHACPGGCLFGAGQARGLNETLYVTTQRAFDTFDEAKNIINNIPNETLSLICNSTTNVKITEHLMTPEEIAKEKGLSGVMLKDLGNW